MPLPAILSDLEKLKPFNIDLLQIDQDAIAKLQLKEIRSLDIFNKATGQFHETGLFSVDIFGKPLSRSRTSVFAYIDLRMDVLHPLAFKMLTRMSSLYKEILEGKRYAIFDDKLKDFVESEDEGSNTGYKFFMDHLPRLDLKKNKSRKRNAYIDFLYQNRQQLIMRYLLVLPAGQREYTVDENGKPSEDEINTLYRKILYVAESLDGHVKDESAYLYDTNRLALQNALMNLYNYIISLLEGKSKLVQGKWGSRKVYISSRNVITPTVVDVPHLDGDKQFDSNNTIVGLYQYCKTIFPLFFNNLKSNLFASVFLTNDGRSRLIDPKTLKSVEVFIPTKLYDTFMNYDEFENFFNSFSNADMRTEVVKVHGHYLCLIYEDEKTVRLLLDIDQDPSLDKTKIRPINYTELFYLYCYDLTQRTPCFVTRYPVTGYGSIYPSIPYLKVTDKAKTVEVYDLYGNLKEKRAPEFPQSDVYFDSISPSSSALGRLGADFDGDTVSFTCVMTDEAVEEIHDLLRKKSYYINGSNQVYFGLTDDIVSLTVNHLTSDVPA